MVRPLLAVACALILSLPLGGCTTEQKEPATVDYRFGTLTALLDAPLTAAHTAAGKALVDLNLVGSKDHIDTTKGTATVVGRNDAGQRVKIDLEAKTETTSAVTIRVGTLGARDLSRAVLARVKANL